MNSVWAVSKMALQRCLLVVYLCLFWNERATGQPCADGYIRDTNGTCVDKDECLSDPCGPNTICHNTEGSFYCTCNRGFYSTSIDRQFAGKNESYCKDYNECETTTTTCGNNASCHNNAGSFYCTCHEGFARASGERTFTGYGKGCQDVNECHSSPCGSHANCTNTVGSYICTCDPGFISSSGGSRMHRTDTCIKFDCSSDEVAKCSRVAMETESMQGNSSVPEYDDPTCSFISFFRDYNVCEKLHSQEDFDSEQYLKNLTSLTGELLRNQSLLENLGAQNRQRALEVSLQTMENSVIAFAYTLSDQEKKNMSFGNIEVQMEVIRGRNFSDEETASLSAKGNQMDIHWRAVTDGEDPGFAGVALIAFSEMDTVLNGSLDSKEDGSLRLNSHVLTVTSTRKNGQALIEPINVTFRNARDPWHLLNLSLMSYIGISISLVCLIISFITFLACRAIQGTRTTIHAHLCLCLFLAELLFLVGISQTNHQLACAFIAGFLHYFFLTVFAWMCLEGIQLFLMVVKVFNAGCLRKRHMLLFGYGLPLLVVGISVAINREGYGTSKHCWLSLEKHFVWSFLGPVCAIIMINMVFYSITLFKLARKMSSIQKDAPKLKKFRSFTVAAIAQLFVLGCTWIFGIFHFQKETISMAYIFTVINSLQGAFIFILHCLLNKQVRDEYRKLFPCCLKPILYSDFMQTSSVPMVSLQLKNGSTYRTETISCHNAA
ncbi:adhesion G protein-coupled receptor E2-like isoform X2 [Rhincodon typus]|uniref:adhesion G protein-coupled receptor E2-like isoform X2 n=1 Tax=Rhincodon typus TaxID=259920 RepID=UPI00203005A1|nr:adhesion G protein-coupled receptor E2-like isoform X2 [Rhincodon typus]